MEEQVLYGDLNMERLKEIAEVKDAVFNETFELSVNVYHELQTERLPRYLHDHVNNLEWLYVKGKKKEFVQKVEEIIGSINSNINIQVRRSTYNAIKLLESTR